MADRHGAKWTIEEERALYRQTVQDLSDMGIAANLRRRPAGIRARQRRLGLRDSDGKLVKPTPEFRPLSKVVGTYQDALVAMAAATKSDAPSEALPSKKAPPQTPPPQMPKPPQRLEVRPTLPARDDDVAWAGLLRSTLMALIDAQTFSRNSPATDARARRIVVERLGVLTFGDDVPTLEDLGQEYGVTRERIRQIERHALRRLTSAVRRGSNLFVDVVDKLIDKSADDEDDKLAGRAAFIDAIDGPRVLRKFLLSVVLMRWNGSSWRDAERLAEKSIKLLRKMRTADRRSSRRQMREVARDDAMMTADRCVLDLLAHTVWPTGQTDPPTYDLAQMQPVRDVTGGRTLFSEKLGRAVQFESGGERRVLEALDRSSFVDHYLEQPFAIPYRSGGVESIYHPDILLSVDKEYLFVLEIKSRLLLVAYRTLLKGVAAVRHLRPLGLGYCLVDAFGCGLKDIAIAHIPAEIEHAVMSSLASDTTATNSSVRRRLGRTIDDGDLDAIQALIIREGLRYDARLYASAHAPTGYSLNFRISGGAKDFEIWDAVSEAFL